MGFCLLLALFALPARAGDPRVESAIEAVRKTSGETWAKRFRERAARAEKSATYFHGCAVAGRLSLDGLGDPEGISSQMIVFPGGYFTDSFDPKGGPLGFRAPGYEALDVKPVCAGNLVWLDLTLKKAAPERLGAVRVRLDPKTARVTIYPALAPPNKENMGVDARYPCEGRCSGVPGPIVHVDDGVLLSTGLSPIVHGLELSAPGYVQDYTTFPVRPGETTDLGTVSLEKARRLTIRYLSSVRLPFKGEPQVSTATASESWSSMSKTSERWWHEVMFKQKEGKVSLMPAVGPADIADLGPGTVEDFAVKAGEKLIDPKAPDSAPLVEGHVYLFRERYLGRWLLLTAKFEP